VTGLAQHGGKHPDACGVDAIIVTDQDAHLRFNRLIFQEFDSVTLSRGRDRPRPCREPAITQVRRVLCRKRAVGPTLPVVMRVIEST